MNIVGIVHSRKLTCQNKTLMTDLCYWKRIICNEYIHFGSATLCNSVMEQAFRQWREKLLSKASQRHGWLEEVLQ